MCLGVWGVTGVEPDYAFMRSYEPQIGRFITEEVSSRARVCVLGVTPVKELFGGQNPIGKQVKINRQTFTVVRGGQDKRARGCEAATSTQ